MSVDVEKPKGLEATQNNTRDFSKGLRHKGKCVLKQKTLQSFCKMQLFLCNFSSSALSKNTESIHPTFELGEMKKEKKSYGSNNCKGN